MQELVKQVLERAIEIQQIPAPTFQEGARADFVRRQFQEEGLAEVSVDDVGNVYARLPGQGGRGRKRKPLVVSAHLDTVFPLETNLAVARRSARLCGPGIGDNALGVAGLFGLLWAVRRRGESLAGDLWLVANVCEEGLGDLRGMRAVVDRFSAGVTGYIVLEGMAFGQVYHRGLGVQRHCIKVTTSGGHSWVDYGRPSAVHELAGLVARLSALPLPASPRTTLNVGIIRGGTSVNTIAAQAELELDLRSEDVAALAALVEQVETIAAALSRPGVQVHSSVIGRRPSGEISAGHPLVKHALRCLERQGVQPRLNIGSTDANIPFSQGFPAVCIGLSTGAGAHTGAEFIHTQPVAKGLAQLVDLVSGAYEL